MKIYIYIYTNIEENHPECGWSYIGVSDDPERRCAGHLHAKSLIGAKLRKHDFDFDILDVVDSYEEAHELEQLYIEEVNTLWPNGYNLDSGGQGGRKVSEETRQKLRKPHGPMLEETKQKLREAKLGKKQTPEHIAKRVENKKRNGKKRSEESKEKNRKAMVGKKQSPEHIAKIVETRKRNGTYKHSEESKQKQRKVMTGKKSPLVGRKQSPEHTAKIVEIKKRNKTIKELGV